MTDTNNSNTVDSADLHTIIAALRYWQESGMADPFNRSNELHELATNDGEVLSSLDDEGIDDLVYRLNTGALELLATNCAS
ncbi:hypothetical protein ACS8E9_17500 [Pseudomonas neustonica]|uniref:hypothetical protein n=1 Tax=Pseudomonas neustonica TaxID=2487346 RepID=UPI003F454377|tara:strand:+ start:7070 stop:7312 length:243 start_codon:yes stop_codon:yes gene_type:complete